MSGLMEVESQDLEAPGFPFPSESGLGALLLPPVLSQSWLQGFKNDQTVSLCYGLTLGFTQTLNDILGSGRFCWYSFACCWWYSAGVERTGVIGTVSGMTAVLLSGTGLARAVFFGWPIRGGQSSLQLDFSCSKEGGKLDLTCVSVHFALFPTIHDVKFSILAWDTLSVLKVP